MITVRPNSAGVIAVSGRATSSHGDIRMPLGEHGRDTINVDLTDWLGDATFTAAQTGTALSGLTTIGSAITAVMLPQAQTTLKVTASDGRILTATFRGV